MVKVEYFAEGAQDCPLLLIYGDGLVNVLALSLAFKRVATGLADYVDVQNIANFHAVNGCQLRLQLSKRAGSGVQLTEENCFVWHLTAEECHDVIGLLEPFSKRNDHDADKQRHQILEGNGAIKVIFSTKRRW